MRYSLSTCLFSQPEEPPNKPDTFACIIDYACEPLKPALAVDLKASARETWGYCEQTNNLFTVEKLKNCVDCLKVDSDQSYLANCTFLPTPLCPFHER